MIFNTLIFSFTKIFYHLRCLYIVFVFIIIFLETFCCYYFLTLLFWFVILELTAAIDDIHKHAYTYTFIWFYKYCIKTFVQQILIGILTSTRGMTNATLSSSAFTSPTTEIALKVCKDCLRGGRFLHPGGWVWCFGSMLVGSIGWLAGYFHKLFTFCFNIRIIALLCHNMVVGTIYFLYILNIVQNVQLYMWYVAILCKVFLCFCLFSFWGIFCV